MLIIYKQQNNKRSFYTYTTTTASFTNQKCVGLCTIRKNNESVSSILFRKKILSLKKRIQPYMVPWVATTVTSKTHRY